VQRQQPFYCPADEFIVIDYRDERPVPFRIHVYFSTSARDVMRAGQASSGALRIAGREDPVCSGANSKPVPPPGLDARRHCIDT